MLSAEGVRGRVHALTELLRSTEAVELLALDSRKSFQSNKLYYQERLEQEAVPAIREMLRHDMDHLDEIQSTTASAREFDIVYRVNNAGAPARAQRSGSRGERSRSEMSELSPEGGSEGYGVCGDAKQLEKRIRDCGFHVRMADEQDAKRILAVYYQQDVTTEHKVKNAMLFNLLSYLSDKLLTEGNTAAALDELYIWLSNPTAVE